MMFHPSFRGRTAIDATLGLAKKLFHPSFRGVEQLARLSFQRGSNYCSITHFKRPAAVRAYSLMKELFKAVLKNSCGALFHVVAGCIVAIPSISMGLLLCQAETAWLPRCSTPQFDGGTAVVRASGPDV